MNRKTIAIINAVLTVIGGSCAHIATIKQWDFPTTVLTIGVVVGLVKAQLSTSLQDSGVTK